MEISSVAQVVCKENIVTAKEDINQSVHDGWWSLVTSTSMFKEQKNVVQDSNATDNVLVHHDNVVHQSIWCSNDPKVNDAEGHWSRLHKMKVNINAFQHLNQNCSTEIVVDVSHDKLPREIQIPSLNSRSGVVEINLTWVKHLLEGQHIPNLEEIPDFRDGMSRRNSSCICNGNLLNDEHVLDQMGLHSCFHLQRGMRETWNCMEEDVRVVHLQILARRDLEVGRQERLDDFLDESLAQLDECFLFKTFAIGASVPSQSGLGSNLCQIKSDVGQWHCSSGDKQMKRKKKGVLWLDRIKPRQLKEWE